MSQHPFQSIPDLGVDNLSIRVKVIGKWRCSRGERSGNQENLKCSYRAQKIIFDGWKLNPVVRFMMLGSFGPLD